MNDWKAIPTIVLVTVLIFGAGVFTGGLLVNQVQKTHPKPAARKATPPSAASSVTTTTNEPPKLRPPEILSKKFLQQLDTELGLKPAQRESIEKIIEDGQNQMRKTMQDARLEIRDVLTAEQRVQFDELVKRPFRKSLFNTNAPSSLAPTNSALTNSTP